MTAHRPTYYRDAETCAEEVLRTVGKRIVLGVPLGIGKPNQLLNELFRRAMEDPGLELRICTALSLQRPTWENELERRLVEPLAARIFGDYPDLAYVPALKKGELPPNIEVREFFFAPGSLLNSPAAQQAYTSSNYTHVVRDLLDNQVNVVAQLIKGTNEGDETLYSLSCNPDITPDLIPALREQEKQGRKIAIIGQVNENLPFMYGDAVVAPDTFDAIIDNPAYSFKLFGPPKMAVSTPDYLLALHASALIKDGGTLQLGIGSLGDAVTYLLRLRHMQGDTYRALLSESGTPGNFEALISRVGGTGEFKQGLYAVSEMLVDGFLELYRCGILKRKVYDDAALQRLLNEGKTPDGETGLKGGVVAHAGFFLGPQSFYDGLRSLDEAQRRQICMSRVSFVNQLYGDQELKTLQRKDARFLNTGIMATLTGAVVSDGLEDGRVLSGVGGQYNFVAMAHALEGARSILMIRSTREDKSTTRSNIVWSYGHVTIPRHLRDIVVTEYGIADLRGKTDREVILSLLHIADSRFQQELLGAAKRAQKIPQDYRIPEQFTNNRPERLEQELKPYRERGLFPEFPFGTDFTSEEIVLGKALRLLRKALSGGAAPLPPAGQLSQLSKIVSLPESAQPYLKRMQLDRPGTLKEKLLQKAVLYGLVLAGAV